MVLCVCSECDHARCREPEQVLAEALFVLELSNQSLVFGGDVVDIDRQDVSHAKLAKVRHSFINENDILDVAGMQSQRRALSGLDHQYSQT